MTSLRLVPIALAFLAFVLTAPASAAVINVPADQPTIQAAITAAAASGDEVVVASGTYVEAIDFLGKAVIVRGATGDPADVIIDGNGALHTVQCVTGEGAGALLQDVTVTGGVANGGGNDDFGGGMIIVGASPTITNCIFEGNTAVAGGGMYVTLGAPTLTDCDFTANTTSTLDGAGLYAYDQATLVLSNCTFENNVSGRHGGGLAVRLLSNVVATGCTFTGNTASNGTGKDGGGVWLFDGIDATFTGCTFELNTASEDGGGLYVENSTADLDDCTFTNNTAKFGGGMLDYGSSSTVTNCSFTGNTATTSGGGMYNFAGGSPTVTNCSFTGNAASVHGGGMFNNTGSNPTVTDCTFTANTTVQDGGGMYNQGASPTVTSCTFSGNTAAVGGGISNRNFADTTVVGCTFEGNMATDAGGGMSSRDDAMAKIIDCGFFGNSAASNGGGLDCTNYGVQEAVNCVFSGNTAGNVGGAGWTFEATSYFTNCTLVGNSATTNGGGLYTFSFGTTGVANCIVRDNTGGNLVVGGHAFGVTYSNVAGGSAGTGNIDADPLFFDPDGPDDVVGTLDDDLRVRRYSPCIDAGNNGAVPADVADLDGDLNTTEPIPFDRAGNARFIDDTGIADSGSGTAPLVDMGAYEQTETSVLQTVMLVPGDSIQDAILASVDGEEVVLNPGVYAIAQTIDFLGRAITLRGATGDPADVVLDGGGAVRVVQCVSGEGPGTVLEGVTVTGGLAIGGFPENSGGGMYNDGASPTVMNCTFSGNSADRGGGMYNNNSIPAVIDCTFSGNSADRGGGMHNFSSSPTVTNCTFTGNTAGLYGGGMYNFSSSPTVTNCTFTGNTADLGGGMHNYTSSSPTVTNCTFDGNTANSAGGGMFNESHSSPTVTNCTFSSNTADNSGGAMYNNDSSPTLTNCTFSGNTAENVGGGMYNWFSSPTVTNCILWGNSPDEIGNSSTSNPLVTFSNVQGGHAGAGNIDADPLFVDADGPDDVVGTLDDDLRLAAGSPCLNAGSNAGLPADAADLDGDMDTAEPTPLDLDGNPRVAHGDVDLGAYESSTAFSVVNLTTMTGYATIQAAIDDATGGIGEIIELAPRTYFEAIDFSGKALTVRSASGDPADTIIDGDGALHVVQCVNGEGPDTVLEGVTITGGNASGTSFPDNVGGGMLNDNASRPTVTNCTFSGNTANVGGGMYNTWLTVVTNCTFSGNTAVQNGGGMLNNFGSPTVTDCLFTGNTAGDRGGGMYNNGSSPTVTNCTFSGNTAGDRAGGMYNAYGSTGSSPTVTNCTFAGNTATSGGWMYTFIGNPTVVNSIVWGNTPTAAEGSISVTFSIVEGGWPGTGNIDANPLFVDADGPDGIPGTLDDDLRLAAGSPAIDAGAIASLPADVADLDGDGDIAEPLPLDLDGVARVQSCRPDMGAYETALVGDSDGDGISNCDEDAAALQDPDGDGLANYLDDDSDGDGILDADEGADDPDGDGIPNFVDVDSDGDGILDADETADDFDGDGIPNYLDDDSDGDGILDADEAGDLDGDAVLDALDLCNDTLPGAIVDAFGCAVIQNLTKGTTHSTIDDAIQGASDNDDLIAPVDAFVAEPDVDFDGRAVTLSADGAIMQLAAGEYILETGVTLATAPGEPMMLGGDVRVDSGPADFEADTFAASATSAITVRPNASLFVDATTSTLGGQATMLTGTTLGFGDVTHDGTLIALSGSTLLADAFTNTGAITSSSLAILADDLLNADTGHFIGFGELFAPVTNGTTPMGGARITITGDTTAIGDYVNNGTTTVQIGTLTIIGGLTNNGTIVGEVSTTLAGGTAPGDGFHVSGDYVAGPASSLSMPDPVWRFSLDGAYDVAIDANTRYDMHESELRMTGGAGLRTHEVMSTDVGDDLSGLDRTLAGHYPLGTLRITSGATVRLVDTHDNDGLGQATCEALYVRTLIVDAGATLETQGKRVYAVDVQIDGAVDDLGNVFELAPISLACPDDVTVPSDAGPGGAVVTWADPAVTASLCGGVTVDCVPASGSFLPVGTTTVTCTATDDCDNVVVCTFDVTVTPTNVVDLDVRLTGVTGPVTRCIRFVPDGCGPAVSRELSFDAAGRFVGPIEIAAGAWTTLCAKDEQHTLWMTADLDVDGAVYRLAPRTPALELGAGDTDNDGDVDVNDVTWLIGQFGNPALPGSCAWDGTRDADFSGDGVVGSEDFSLLSANWLAVTACPCASTVPGGLRPDRRPATSIDVGRVHPDVARKADLDRNGVIDVRDVMIFETLNGLPDTLSSRMLLTNQAPRR